MIDLRSIARQLRLPVEQFRVAADLLQQGYQPAFIDRYRADETGCLAPSVLWSLKLAIERQQRFAAARDKAIQQLPEGVELDSEAAERLEHADSEVEIDSAMRAFRARRLSLQNAERESAAGQLLEKLIAYNGPPVEDIVAWAQEQLACEHDAAEIALQNSKRLVGSLLSGDSVLAQRMRQIVQRRATVKVELTLDQAKSADEEEGKTPSEPGESTAENDATSNTAEESADDLTAEHFPEDYPTEGDESSEDYSGLHASDTGSGASEAAIGDEDASPPHNEASQPELAQHDVTQHVESTEEPTSELIADGELIAAGETVEQALEAHADAVENTESNTLSFEGGSNAAGGKVTKGSIAKKGKKKRGKEVKTIAKNASKVSPRQRRRRWLVSMLQPFHGLERALSKLSAYQQLMIGRGRRSQLVKVHLGYDTQALVTLARDAFVNDKHPLLKWFNEAVEESLSRSIIHKIEHDAIAELEESAQQKLLESAAEPLREQLQQRPVRGHRILVIDSVGPKTSSVAIIDAHGRVLHTDEVTCSAHPQTVTQNVVHVGELLHRFKVTLVALTNGPARRFLIHTLRELVNQSTASGLRWTMVDRGGSEAYAASRIALLELPEHNRRDRATIWIARRLQDPLREMLKLDSSRMRLGSYQRELPAEPLKKLVNDTIADCVCARGVDTLYASLPELMSVPGVERAQADQILRLVAEGKVNSREELLKELSDWPEAHARQAIGFLRIFGSSNTFDATGVHPDDYRLAERLVQNSELSQPPATPAGWVKPTLVAATANPVATVAEAQSNEPSVQAAADGAIPESAGSEGDASADLESAVSTAASDTSISEAPTEADANPTIAAITDALPSAAAVNEPAITPEFPEDVLAAVPVAATIDVEKLARGWQVGREKLRWIVSCLQDPFRDSRLMRPPVPMMQSMPTLENLQPGMSMWAVVVGVADFGAFVELGPECSGLIHISRLSSNFVEDPHQCVQVGDLLLAWVVSVDSKKRRVAMTAISPAQREAAAAAEAQRASERSESDYRGRQDRGGQGQRGQYQGSAASQGGHNQGQAQGQRRTGQGSQRVGQGQPSGQGQSGGQGQRSGQSGGQGSDRGGSGRSGGDRSRGGGQHAGAGRGQRGAGGGGRGSRDRTSQPIIVTSKKPKAPITEDMQKGVEPLRSFSDLLQFYELKRTDEPAPEVPAPVSPPVAASEATPPESQE